MKTHCSILAWRIPGTKEPGGCQSMELNRAGHDWVTEHTLCKQLMIGCPDQKMGIQIHLMLQGWVYKMPLYFFSFIFISWRLITLKYCSGFCYTLTWISHGFTYAPHPEPPFQLPLKCHFNSSLNRCNSTTRNVAMTWGRGTASSNYNKSQVFALKLDLQKLKEWNH